MKLQYFAAAAILCGILTGCGEAKFKIDGEVTGAEGKTLILEKSDFGGIWVALDSTKIGGSGHFSISSPAPASPEIYRLSLGDRFVYLPVDSIETLTLSTTESDFGHKFSLKGSPQAELMAQFEQELLQLQSPDSTAMANFKRNVYTKYIQNGQGSILGYYVLTKIHGDRPLYDPADPQDAKYYAAVATQFDNFRPNDPHGRMVKEASLQAMRKRNSDRGLKTVIEANEISMLDIDLPDNSGKNRKLSEIVGKGKPVVVVFSMMNEAESPAFNRELARIYNSRPGNFEIYQVSFDEGVYEWRDAVANLPWINVIDPAGTSSTVVRDYNLGGLPAVFLYDATGQLVDRPATLKDLEKNL